MDHPLRPFALMALTRCKCRTPDVTFVSVYVVAVLLDDATFDRPNGHCT